MSKLTKEQLHGVSDFEVNKALCTLVGKDVSGICELRNQMTGAVNDYCSTPNDIMPLAFEHLVNVQWFMDSKEVRAYTHSGKSVTVSYQRTSRQQAALRAHACCLILVLQEGK